MATSGELCWTEMYVKLADMPEFNNIAVYIQGIFLTYNTMMIFQEHWYFWLAELKIDLMLKWYKNWCFYSYLNGVFYFVFC